MRKQPGFKQMFALFLVFALVFQTLTGAIGVTTAQAEESSDLELKILHTNDIHSAIDPLGKAAAYINAEREAAEYSLYLDAGDIFSGNPVVDLEYGKPIVEVLNSMELDAMVIGNHEFDYGQENFALREEESDFPWISANMEVVDDSIAIEQPDPYIEFDLDGVTVGILGLTETPPSTAPAGIVGIDFHDPFATAAEYAHKADEVDVFVALTHHGYTEDRKLAEQVDFFDIIIGGHSHTRLTSPQVVNGTPIVQAGANGTDVGNLTISVDEDTREVTGVEGFLQGTSALTDVHEPTQEIIDYWNELMGEYLDYEIGYSNTGLSRAGRTVRDAPLGNFWTDAMREAGDADIALTNNGGIRADIGTGALTRRDIYTVEPFANQIMVFEMTGQAVYDVIEFSYSRRNSVDLQTSGLHYDIFTYDSGNFYDAEMTVDGEPLDMDATYRVSVADYIGTGGGGYSFEGEHVDDVGLMTDAMMDFAEQLTEAGEDIDYPSNEGRISISVSDEAPIEGEIIGETENGLSSVNNALGDSGLGNLYTDSVREKTDADAAILNASSIDGNIAPGPITDKMIEGLDGFGNEIVTVDTTGDRMKEVLLGQANYHGGVDVQVSGLKYELVEGDETSDRFDSINLFFEDGTPVEDEDVFHVGYNDFMHGQGFYNLGDENVNDDYGKVWESIVEYVENHEGPIDYVEGERISIDYKEGDGPGPGPVPGDALTVAEAIENQGQDAEVVGYIVGHITSTNNVNFTPPFANDFNFAMADSADETNLDNMLFVQVPASFRGNFGLSSNPENVGERVLVDGSLQAYFQRPGLQGATSFDFVGEEEDPYEPVSIAEAREIPNGEKVTVEGTVTSNPGGWGAYGFYLQDETAGIYVYHTDDEGVEKGDTVLLTGERDAFNGELQISNLENVEVTGTADVPAPLELTPSEVGVENESQLVKLSDVTIENLQAQGNFGTFEFDAVSGDESILIRVDNRTGLDYDSFAFENGDVVDVTGLSSRFHDTVQVKPRGEDDIVPAEEEEEEDNVRRIYGEDRYETSLALADEIENNSLDYVFLASGSNFADALAGGALNQSLNGTVLLVHPDEARVAAAMDKTAELLKADGEVIVLGGEAAVDAAIYEAFDAEFDVERVYGENRAQTSIEIANLVNPDADEVFVVSGADFADALSIVPFAAKTETPILLNWSSSVLSDDIHAYVTEQGISTVTVIGGPAAVPNDAVAELVNAGASVARVYGSNRYETSVAVKSTFFPNAEKTGIASGQTFPDALSAGRFALDHDMPILLTSRDSLPAAVEAHLDSSPVERAYIFGGPNAVSDEVKSYFE
ncbi:multifunctional 2',3'-cyclic-nucleotide 2'-phosphodiesterase/5'-nucleotidase/3'-nucleotidase [Alteribacter lacisalsi]|uniref:Multifunctional 2',3'-cyclic-nucleotide 2'-phosphodiesterase/5'-nucleotidase/3'-nucleotidase n=1 Tax=Alteribacter lacisalsi TaxID=2045244 RepID=A0A2W0HQC5_9BACI|nr:5'-nucleotidase C-terminal domain-containing protein [Alteribacter lacisalsi]PYZ95778.1 multifunctional 2',3'-cyclic-nucleotide 2'-phosphodiesterase/5'-nucleotidase/3'-nucleotidase [Alteribacter lacisalsi]